VPSPPTERVVAVIELLAAAPQRRFSLAELCRELGLSRATGHAILTTLTEHRWVDRDDTAAYSYGPGLDALTRPLGGSTFRPQLQTLADSVGAQVFLARRVGGSLLVTDSVGESAVLPGIEAGLRMPLVAPFGRDYVAWDGRQSVAAWLGGIGAPSPTLRRRLTAVLAEVRTRGYVVERLSREYVRVYLALRALAADGEPDPIAARLAGAFADLTLVDYVPGELDETGAQDIATVSAPIRNANGDVAMSLTAAPFRACSAAEVRALGAEVRAIAGQLEAPVG
jgi:DNA-binding IclR family transcriptional regulator